MKTHVDLLTFEEHDPSKYHLAHSHLPLQVAFIAPSFPSVACEVSTYTSYLADHLQPRIPVHILGTAGTKKLGLLLNHASELAGCVDLIHIQHAFDLYGYMGYLTIPLLLRLNQTGCKVVVTLHDLPLTRSRDTKSQAEHSWFVRLLQQMALHTDALIVHTNTARIHLEAWGISKNVYVIPHGTLYPVPLYRPIRECARTTHIGIFGYFSPDNGVVPLLEALPTLPEVRLTLAGRAYNSEEQYCQQVLHERVIGLGLTDRVTFFDVGPNEAAGAFLNALDVVIFPCNHMSLAGTLYAALSHQRLVLTGNLLPFLEIQQQYHCLATYLLEQPESLVTAIRQLLEKCDLRQRLQAGCRALIDATRWDVVATRHLQLYTALCSERQKDAFHSALQMDR
jgi:glycosyltransferase involved in cell wall biosynthesis